MSWIYKLKKRYRKRKKFKTMRTLEFLFLEEFRNSKDGKNFQKHLTIRKDLKGAFMLTSSHIPYVFIDTTLFSSKYGNSVDEKIRSLSRVAYHELYHALCSYEDTTREKCAQMSERLLLGIIDIPSITVEVE